MAEYYDDDEEYDEEDDEETKEYAPPPRSPVSLQDVGQASPAVASKATRAAPSSSEAPAAAQAEPPAISVQVPVPKRPAGKPTIENYAKALAELKTLSKWNPVELGDTPIKFGVTIDAPRRNLYESNKTLEVLVEFPPGYPVTPPSVTLKMGKGLLGEDLQALSELARIHILSTEPDQPMIAGLLNTLRLWLCRTNEKRLLMEDDARARESAIMRTMMKSFRVSSEDIFPTVLEEEVEGSNPAAANAGPVSAPEAVHFRPRTEEPSVAELYITSGSSKCCHMEVPDLDGRAFHAAVRLGSKVLVYGGRLPDGNISADVLLVDPVTGSVRNVEVSGSAVPRSGATATKVGRSIYIIGGRSADGTIQGDVFRLNTDDWSWTKLQGASASSVVPRANHAAVWLGDHRIVLIGGEQVRLGGKYHLMQVYDIEGKGRSHTVALSGESVPAQIYGHTATLYQDKIVVFGGVTAAASRDVVIIDPHEWTWKKAQTDGFCPARQNHTCDLFGGKLLVYGGMASSTHGDIAMADLRILDLHKMTWTLKTLVGLTPEPRYGHCSVLFGSSLLLIGGQNNIVGQLRVGYTSNGVNYRKFAPRTSHALSRVQHPRATDVMTFLPGIDRIDTGPRVMEVVRSTLSQELGSMFRESLLADLEVVATGPDWRYTVRSHRIIWHLRAPEELVNLIKPSAPGAAVPYRLELPVSVVKGVKLPHVRAAIEYLYTDCAADDDDDLELFRENILVELAQEMKLQRLVDLSLAKAATPGNIAADLAKAFNNPVLSDFTVAAEGGVKYHAHRCLLACRSEFFRSMLQSGMKEAQSGELYLPMAPAVAEVVLRFVLTDQASMEPERAVELLSVAGQYGLPRLRALCESTIETNFAFDDLDSVLSLLAMADTYRAPHLLQLCAFLVAHEFGLAKARKSEAFSALSKDMVNKLERLEKGWQ